MEQKPISVSDLNQYIKNHLESDNNLINVSVEGEISNLTKHKSGHWYLTLKDNTSEIRCIIFSFVNSKLNYFPKVGDKVITKGNISLYVQRGTYSLNITAINLAGLGEAFLKLQELKNKLEKDGWFKPEFKKPIPTFPKNIGVITSPTGAAIQDILKTTKKRYPQANVYLFPSKVQGLKASEECAEQIQIANHFEVKLDVLIVGRGGGSIEDLWAFNELPVLTGIHNSIIPVVSAVGHEIDHLLSDDVADSFAHTPTAAAELVTPNLLDLWRTNKQLQVKMINEVKNMIDKYIQELSTLKANYHLKNLNWIYQDKEKDLDNLKKILLSKLSNIKDKVKDQSKFGIKNYQTLNSLMKNKINQSIQSKDDLTRTLSKMMINFDSDLNNQHKLNIRNQHTLKKIIDNNLSYHCQIQKGFTQSFNLLDHKNILKRGFSIMYLDSKPVDSIKKISKNSKVKIQLYDGTTNATINEVIATKGDK